MCQSEQQLENKLIKQLNTLGFESVRISDTQALEKNLKTQLEKINAEVLENKKFSQTEFQQILNHLKKGSRFEKSKILRDKFVVKRSEDTQLKKDVSITFFNSDAWCQNLYQVTHQITQQGKRENRYDVTLLINGFPLVQIELKRRGVEMKQAFNQINRYQHESFIGTLFDYIQIFVISNGVNTKYYANNPKQDFSQTFYWTDEKNKKIAKLEDFTEKFLEKCQLSQMIAEYIVLAEADKIPMVLRPYQYYAAKAIEKRVKESVKNGYIWHTTGSGKTLTSFKTAQLIIKNPEIKKVIFVLDRKDLDIQTVKEFNSFSENAVDGTDNTKNLVKQLKDTTQKLVVTTIQKLDRAIAREHYVSQFEDLQNERVVIIFDECHRSQFGKTHKAIKQCFQNSQLFGFTGTPILAENNNKGTTTADVFDECLHKYIITDAISDNNVLGFSVEYVGKYTKKKSDFSTDIIVPDIDTAEMLESDKRAEKITDYILKDWKIKTKNGEYNAIFATASQKMAKKYYTLFQEKKPKGFKVATIFTYNANEEAGENQNYEDNFDEADSVIDSTKKIDQHSRDFLENCIKNYNEEMGTNFSTDTFDGYYKDVQARVKDKNKKFLAEGKRIDLVIVVNMMLTGFDAKTMNTLYVDKNLKYHGLIQAYSRTNRLLGKTKPHGNIVCFRNLKENTDDALRLYGDADAESIVFKKSYPKQLEEFSEVFDEFSEKFPDASEISNIQSEEEQVEFVKMFRKLNRLFVYLQMSADFSFEDIKISEQEMQDYRTQYLDLKDEIQKSDKVSILDDLDFELELILQDTINFDYIISLLLSIGKISSDIERKKQIEKILKQVNSDEKWRKKKDLIEKFIEEYLQNIPEKFKNSNNEEAEDVEKIFSEFWDKEKKQALQKISETEEIDKTIFEEILENYTYSQKLPQRQKIMSLPVGIIKLKERTSTFEKLKKIIIDFVDKFEI